MMPDRQSLPAQPEHAWILRLPSPLGEGGPGTLQGLRFAVKDNIDVRGLPTTAACPAFAYEAQATAAVVNRLLAAGAQLDGKTNLDQFACGLNGTRSPYGAVPNAFNPLYVSGGSSAGSAHVVATGQVDFALGTDTAGSGRVPAGLNNIVGLKPSRGLISAAGVVPAAQSVDVVSIFARTVPQAWRVLEAAAGFDPQDPYSRPLTLRTKPLPTALRVGVPDELEFFGDEQARIAFDDALSRLVGMGATLVRVPYAPLRQAAALLYESALVAERHAAVRSFFDAQEGQVVEPVRRIIGSARQFSATDVFEAQTRLQTLAQQVRPMWASIDVLVVPTAPTHVTVEAMQEDPIELNRRLGHYTNFVNLLDYAALSVPSSIRPDGLPFGITFIAPSGSDWALAELGTRVHAESGLSLGATGQPLPAAERRLPPPAHHFSDDAPPARVAVVGAHLSGMPLNGQLTERGARLLKRCRTAPLYRLYALADTQPPKPGLLRVAPGEGGAIELEVWEMPMREYGSFVDLIPAPLGIGRLLLDDGSSVQGFLCEPQALAGAQDITHHGGWRAFRQSLTDKAAHAAPALQP
jgi:allophanate hydrolase